MADKVFVNILPTVKAIDNGDDTHSISVGFAITPTVEIDDSTPIDVNIAAQSIEVMIDDSIPIDVAVQSMPDETVTIDYNHEKIHHGDHYFLVDTNVIANGGSRQYLVVVADDDTAIPHILPALSVSGEAQATITEGVSVDDEGTELVAKNNDRNSANVAATKFYHTPTNPSGGTVLTGPLTLGSGRSGAGASRSDSELILKKNTKYLFDIVNQVSGGTNTILQVFEFYEQNI